MAYRHCPPSLNSMDLVTAFHGFGPHHWSRSSLFVKASHTSETSAANSFFTVIVLFSLSTRKSNCKLLIFYWFLSLKLSDPTHRSGPPTGLWIARPTRHVV